MNGYEYEQACAEYLRKKGFKDVRVTQASRDQGADIIARRKKEKYAFQCKYYSTPVGNKAVQEVYAAATFYDCDRAVVMTNATFTSGAVELAETLGVELMPGIDFAKKRFGVIGLVLLIATVAMGGLLYIAIAKPELPEWLSFLQPERIADPRNIAFLSAGTVLSLLLLIMRCRRPRSYALRADTITAKQESGATAEGLADTEDGQLDEEDLTGDEDDPGDGEDDDLIDDADARLGEAGERLGNEDDLSGVPSVNGNAGGGEYQRAGGQVGPNQGGTPLEGGTFEFLHSFKIFYIPFCLFTNKR